MQEGFGWDDLRYLLAVNRTGSLAAAGRALSVDETTVGRRIAAFERLLGARLFDRTPDGLLATSIGAAIVPAALRIEADVALVAALAAGADSRIEGPVRLTSTEAFGARVLSPHLPALLAAHPAIELELITDARALDLGRREADLAVRLNRPREARVVTRKIGELAVGLYASDMYLAGRGPVKLGLRGHAVVLFGLRPLDIPEERWLKVLARDADVTLRSGSAAVQLAAVAAGAGIAALPCYLAAGEVGFRRLLPREAIHREIWLAVRHDLKDAPRVRAVAAWVHDAVERQRPMLQDEARPSERDRARRSSCRGHGWSCVGSFPALGADSGNEEGDADEDSDGGTLGVPRSSPAAHPTRIRTTATIKRRAR
jgi:DNA-binding transcriptional LysR family regulator